MHDYHTVFVVMRKGQAGWGFRRKEKKPVSTNQIAGKSDFPEKRMKIPFPSWPRFLLFCNWFNDHHGNECFAFFHMHKENVVHMWKLHVWVQFSFAARAFSLMSGLVFFWRPFPDIGHGLFSMVRDYMMALATFLIPSKDRSQVFNWEEK